MEQIAASVQNKFRYTKDCENYIAGCGDQTQGAAGGDSFIQQEGIDYDDKFAPLADMESVRVLLTLVAQEGW